jgi:hypothetical protein
MKDRRFILKTSVEDGVEEVSEMMIGGVKYATRYDPEINAYVAVGEDGKDLEAIPWIVEGVPIVDSEGNVITTMKRNNGEGNLELRTMIEPSSEVKAEIVEWSFEGWIEDK